MSTISGAMVAAVMAASIELIHFRKQACTHTHTNTHTIKAHTSCEPNDRFAE